MPSGVYKHKPLTKETRAKISRTLSGRPKTLKHKKAISRGVRRHFDEKQRDRRRR